MRFLIALLGITVALTACTAKRELHYWQKTDADTALYLTGPKAQQILEENIAECVHLIIELTKIENVRDGVPPYADPLHGVDQPDITADMGGLPRWETPERIRELRVNHSDFHDFDGCMREKGWERVKYVFPDQEEKSKRVYNSINP